MITRNIPGIIQIIKTFHGTSVIILVLGIAILTLTTVACDGSVFQGVITVRGTMPHIMLVLTTDEGSDYRLTGSAAVGLHRYQYQKVTLHGRIISEAAGPGFSAALEVTEIIESDTP